MGVRSSVLVVADTLVDLAGVDVSAPVVLCLETGKFRIKGANTWGDVGVGATGPAPSGTGYVRVTNGVLDPVVTPVAMKTALALVKADVGLSLVDNTADLSKPLSTAEQTALGLKTDLSVLNTLLGSYKTILQTSGSHIAAKAAGTYAMGQGDPLAITGVGTLYPIAIIQIAAADYPTVNGLAAKLRLRAQLASNDVAPFVGTFTLGLFPSTRPATSGAAGVCIYTLGTVVPGSNGAVFTNVPADALLNAVGVDFTLPADGPYVIGVVTSAVMAVSSHVHINASLQIRNN